MESDIDDLIFEEEPTHSERKRQLKKRIGTEKR